jgi:hypothetical protein
MVAGQWSKRASRGSVPGAGAGGLVEVAASATWRRPNQSMIAKSRHRVSEKNMRDRCWRDRWVTVHNVRWQKVGNVIGHSAFSKRLGAKIFGRSESQILTMWHVRLGFDPWPAFVEGRPV